MSAVVNMVTFRMGSDELDTVVVMAMPVFWQKIIVQVHMHVVVLCKLQKLGAYPQVQEKRFTS